MGGGHQRKGRLGEKTAVEYLTKKGYQILSRNYNTPFGEIDIVAADGSELVFIEVKAVMSGEYGHPEERVTFQKQRRIGRAAAYYLERRNEEIPDCRFDVLAIEWGSRIDIMHFEDAFRL